MKTRSLEKWIWILIDGGLLIFGFGRSVGLHDEAVGSAIALAGAVVVAIGVLGPVNTKDASANAVIGAQGRARGAAKAIRLGETCNAAQGLLKNNASGIFGVNRS